MKRNLILLSSALLLLNCPAQAAARKTGIIPPPPAIPVARPSEPAPAPEKPAAAPAAKTSNIVTLGTAGPYTAKTNKAQRFADYVEIKPGQESCPLTLTITNGGDKAGGFSWFRLFVANRLMATQKDLSKTGEGKVDMTGAIQSGSNQIVIEGAGNAGAQIGWKLTTIATCKLDKVDPDEALLEDTIKVKGSNFDSNPSKDQVFFNKVEGKVESATEKELKVKIPKTAEIGDNKVTAKVGGIESNSLSMKIRGIPELASTNLQGVPPGQQLVIYGKNFSKQTGENKVFFGDTAAEVVSGNTETLTVIVPFIPYEYGTHGPSNIKVQVGKIASKNTLPVQVGPQMFQDPAFKGGPDTPQLGPGFPMPGNMGD